MDLSELLIFKTVAEEGGIIRAARKLHRVQSNVTTRIKQLETSIGAQLFFRDRQRLVLSPRGQTLLAYADKLLRLADEARTVVSGQSPSGALRLGALESTSRCRSRKNSCAPMDVSSCLTLVVTFDCTLCSLRAARRMPPSSATVLKIRRSDRFISGLRGHVTRIRAAPHIHKSRTYYRTAFPSRISPHERPGHAMTQR